MSQKIEAKLEILNTVLNIFIFFFFKSI